MALNLNDNIRLCEFRTGDRCKNGNIIGEDLIIDDNSLQCKWHCSVCEHFKPKTAT